MIERLITLMFTLGRLAHSQANKSKEMKGFSVLEVETLRYIEGADTPTMKEVAHYLSITPGSATVLVNRLVRDGYLKRISTAHDRREVRLVTTAKGKRFRKECFEKRAERLRAMLSHLTKKDQKELFAILGKMAVHYEGER